MTVRLPLHYICSPWLRGYFRAWGPESNELPWEFMPTSHFSNHLPSNLETFIKTLCFVSESCPIYVVYRIETGPLTQSVWIICLLPGSEMPPSQKRLKLLEEKKITFLRNIPAFSLFFFGEEGGSPSYPALRNPLFVVCPDPQL